MLLLLAGAASVLRPEPPLRTSIVTIDNSMPRRDVDGKIIDAHGGCLHFYDGRYYLYGEAYGKTAGYTINNRFRDVWPQKVDPHPLRSDACYGTPLNDRGEPIP